ncbi:MAG: hypothetical protein KF825_13665 [Ferruginibacter sp.]|nr:hypothetical protein [Ferruginibacter sp.]
MRFLFLIVYNLCAIICFAQKKDYIIKNNGDTVYGKIVLKDKHFVVSAKGKQNMVVNATDVKTAHLRKYKGRFVLPCKLNTYIDNLEFLERYKYVTHQIDTVLLLSEVYRSPKMNLYFCTDTNEQQYYFFKTPKDSLPIQLYVNYALAGGSTGYDYFFARGQDAITHIEVQRAFVNQLKLAMEDCPSISKETWLLLDYRIYSFKKLIKLYNECK